MIKRIKRKYTLVVMSSVIVVLGLIITAINVANYTSINSLLNEKLEMLVDNEGLMPDLPFGEDPEEDDQDPPRDEGTDNDGESTDGTGDTAQGDGENEGNSDESTADGNGSNDQSSDENGDSGSATDTGNEDADAGDDNSDSNTDGAGEDQPADGTEGSDTEGDEAPDDELPADKEEDKNGEEKEDEEEDKFYQHMSPETPFELRYFSVKLNTDGGVLAVDTSKIAAVDTLKAEGYAKAVFDSDKDQGYLDSYKYMMGSTEDGNLIYVFLDVDRELRSFRSFLISSLVITALGILTVLAMVLLLSDTALKPIIESYEKQKRFITDAGHEMKTPLTVISANTEIIELESGENQWTSGIKSQVLKLASLTEKLVILSKMEEGAKLEMNEFSLSEAFFDTCEQYKSIAMSRNVKFESSIAENVSIVGNENEIRRCITLLLDNAFRYTNEGGFVSVKVQSLLNGVEIKFTNSTDGIQKGTLDNWFDRFYRTDLSRNSDTGGSGIGLSVVKAIILAHGGTVKAQSPDGINVEFTINI